jgi:hypothetical protein
MRTQEMTENTLSAVTAKSSGSMSMPSAQSYHELSEMPVRETDLVEQLEDNLSQLQDLQSRLQFMMREIRYVMKV